MTAIRHPTGDGSDEARCQHTSEKDGDDGVTVPPQAGVGAVRGGKGDTVGGRNRAATESTRDAIALFTIVVTAAPSRWEGLLENPGGGV